MKRLLRGRHSEHRALRFLERHGLRHVASNYRSRHGEIDLIMRDGDTLVFVEVRYRRSRRYGGAAASVDNRKIHRLVRTGQAYLQQHDLLHAPCRFDVVAFEGDEQIEWIQNAFEAPAP